MRAPAPPTVALRLHAIADYLDYADRLVEDVCREDGVTVDLDSDYQCWLRMMATWFEQYPAVDREIQELLSLAEAATA